MTTQQTRDSLSLQVHPAAPRHFDPLTADAADLRRHGIPRRPDAQRQPGLAALWDRQVRRWRGFEHLEPQLDLTTATSAPVRAAGIGPDPSESSGFSLFTNIDPFTALFVTWTVPHPHYVADPEGVNNLHTFVGLGFLDVHVQMTVDAQDRVTSALQVQGAATNLPVRPGDVLSASMCLDTAAPGRATYVLANESRGQTINLSFDSGYPPAVSIDAGITRDDLGRPGRPVARFGAVYFDEISAYTTAGYRSLTSGGAITMVDQQGRTLASPVRMTDYAFKIVDAAA